MVAASLLVARQRPNSEKLSPYECGFEPFEDARIRFDVRYYLVAILFIIFDLEVAFLFPWAVSLGDIGVFGFWSMIVFLGGADDRLHLRMEEGGARMGVIETPTAPDSCPAAEQDLLLKAATEEVQDRGFIVATLDNLVNWARTRLAVADDLRPGLLRRRDDAHRRQPLRPRPLRRRVPRRARASPT